MKNSQIPGLKLLGTRNTGFVLAAWLALEIVAFMFVAHAVGLFVALLLAIATTTLGFADIRRLLDYWRKRVTGQASRAGGKEGAMLDGGLQALASVLLILPGFVSDFVGLALKSPSVRAGLARRLSEKNFDPRMIDLAPGEWAYETEKKPARKRAPRKRSGE